MGKNTFVATLKSTGQSKSYTINVIDIEFVKGYWTKDKEGKEPLEKNKSGASKAKLGQTVYFHVDVKGLADEQEIELSLAEFDYNNGAAFLLGSSKLLRDVIDPDDRKFPEEEVVKKATVKNDRATVELLLHESWEGMIKDDHEEWFSLNESLELYWEVSYKGKYKTELPNKEDNYLLVGQNDRTLYIKTPSFNHNLPEFFSNNGDPMILMEFGKGFGKGKIKEKILDVATQQAEKSIRKIAFTKLEKGFMVDNNGKVYKGKRLVHEYKKIYDNSGELFENVKKGKDFGYKHANKPLVTTKGISQYDYFSKSGKRVTFLGMVKNIGKVFDLFDLFSAASKDLDMSEPIPLDFGPLSPIVGLIGVLAQEQRAESDQFLLEDMQLEVDEAKLMGLEATRSAINSWYHELNTWELLPVSNNTANKLLQNEFDTFDELEKFSRSDVEDTGFYNIEILYRKVENTNKEKYIYIIETIFINE